MKKEEVEAKAELAIEAIAAILKEFERETSARIEQLCIKSDGVNARVEISYKMTKTIQGSMK